MKEANSHRFRVCVEKLNAAATPARLTFEVRNHDDILAVMDRVRAGTAFPPDEASALALGLKLLAGVTLAHRHDPLFADIHPALRAFIGNLKSRVASTTTGP